MKQFLDYTISTLEKKNMKGLFYKAIPSVIFNLLKKYESISLIRFELILNLLKENFQYASEMEIPIKYLEIGIQHLVKKEKNALLKLTKEERDTFNKFVLNDAITI
jgi:hypothetical protein